MSRFSSLNISRKLLSTWPGSLFLVFVFSIALAADNENDPAWLEYVANCERDHPGALMNRHNELACSQCNVGANIQPGFPDRQCSTLNYSAYVGPNGLQVIQNINFTWTGSSAKQATDQALVAAAVQCAQDWYRRNGLQVTFNVNFGPPNPQGVNIQITDAPGHSNSSIVHVEQFVGADGVPVNYTDDNRCGLFAHELGHNMGMDDTYPATGSNSCRDRVFYGPRDDMMNNSGWDTTSTSRLYAETGAQIVEQICGKFTPRKQDNDQCYEGYTFNTTKGLCEPEIIPCENGYTNQFNKCVCLGPLVVLDDYTCGVAPLECYNGYEPDAKKENCVCNEPNTILPDGMCGLLPECYNGYVQEGNDCVCKEPNTIQEDGTCGIQPCENGAERNEQGDCPATGTCNLDPETCEQTCDEGVTPTPLYKQPDGSCDTTQPNGCQPGFELSAEDGQCVCPAPKVTYLDGSCGEQAPCENGYEPDGNGGCGCLSPNVVQSDGTCGALDCPDGYDEYGYCLPACSSGLPRDAFGNCDSCTYPDPMTGYCNQPCFDGSDPRVQGGCPIYCHEWDAWLWNCPAIN